MERRLVLEARGLRKAFKELVAVKDVSFHIAEGETYGLLGPNGAGKTTTISMVCGLLERDAGEVRVDGREITTRSTEAKGAIGYVPQDIAIYPDLTARENLVFFGSLYGMSGKDLMKKMRSLRPDIKVLLISGYTDPTFISEGELEPGTAFLQKPFSPRALAQAVRSVLGGSGTQARGPEPGPAPRG